MMKLDCCHTPLQWGLRLYGATVGVLGALLSLFWVAAHLSCLSTTPGGDATLQRYLNILLGLSLLVSLVSLEYGSMFGERAPLVLFLILNIATVFCYWIWFLYLDHLRLDEREQETGLAPLYLLLVLPVLLLHRSLQEMPYQTEMVVVHVENLEPVKKKEKRGAKMLLPRRKVENEDDLTKILSIPHQDETATKPSWSWPGVAKWSNPSADSSISSNVPTSHQLATIEPAGFSGKLAVLSRKLTKVSDKLTPRHKLVGGGGRLAKKPEKVVWLRAKLAKLGRNNKQISFEVRQPSVEDMQETPRKGNKMKKNFPGVFRKLPAMIRKLSRRSKKE